MFAGRIAFAGRTGFAFSARGGGHFLTGCLNMCTVCSSHGATPTMGDTEQAFTEADNFWPIAFSSIPAPPEGCSSLERGHELTASVSLPCVGARSARIGRYSAFQRDFAFSIRPCNGRYSAFHRSRGTYGGTSVMARRISSADLASMQPMQPRWSRSPN